MILEREEGRKEGGGREREREREGKREREERDINVREKHRLVASRTRPDQGSNPFGVREDAPTNGATEGFYTREVL